LGHPKNANFDAFRGIFGLRTMHVNAFKKEIYLPGGAFWSKICTYF
jgi:hypothetical protein